MSRNGKPQKSGELTPEIVAELERSGRSHPALAYMIVAGLPLTAEMWAQLDYNKSLNELTAEELEEMPEVFREA